MQHGYHGGGRDGAGSGTVPHTVCLAEDDAIRRLNLLDLPGARAALETLLREAVVAGRHIVHAAFVLYDVLGQVEGVVASHEGLPRRGIPERLEAISRLASAQSSEQLAATFWSIYEEMIRPLGALSPPAHPAVEKVKAFVRENYTKKIALSEIARAVGVSRNYLSHLFKRHCGVTVTEFIHRTRMGRAEKLLENGGRTVSEIAYMVGYQNYRDFHRNFVKYEKTSPKKYRQHRALTRKALTTAST